MITQKCVHTYTGARWECRGIYQVVLSIIKKSSTYRHQLDRSDIIDARVRIPIVDNVAAVANVPCRVQYLSKRSKDIFK
jgi:hypothetical protein